MYTNLYAQAVPEGTTIEVMTGVVKEVKEQHGHVNIFWKRHSLTAHRWFKRHAAADRAV